MPADIRDARIDDAKAIGALVDTAFADAPHAGGNEAAIVAALREAGALTLSLVAERGAAVVGHVAVSPVEVGDEATGWFGLGPLSVLPAFRRRGIGAELMRAALARLDAAGARGGILLGDPAYYARFGFVADPSLTWRDLPAGFIQARTLRGAAPMGEVRYHPAFG